MKTLVLYVRPGCHLCEDMEQALRALGTGSRFRLTVLDVEQDQTLEAAYGELIPILFEGGHEICHYHLDAERLETVLSQP